MLSSIVECIEIQAIQKYCVGIIAIFVYLLKFVCKLLVWYSLTHN